MTHISRAVGQGQERNKKKSYFTVCATDAYMPMLIKLMSLVAAATAFDSRTPANTLFPPPTGK